ncbi:unnamed protein product [Cunninghamella echinulata]
MPEAYQELLDKLKSIKEKKVAVATAPPLSLASGPPVVNAPVPIVPTSINKQSLPNTNINSSSSSINTPLTQASIPPGIRPMFTPSPPIKTTTPPTATTVTITTAPIAVPITTAPVVAPITKPLVSTPSTIHSPSVLLSRPPVNLQIDTPEKAMEQFHSLLKSKNITPDWHWEDAMREIITDPRYRVFKTTAERKNAFQLYVDMETKRQREEKEAKIKREQEDFFNMLANIPQIKTYSSFRTILPLIAQQSAYQQLQHRSERHIQHLYQDYIYDLRKQEKERKRQQRKKDIEHVKKYLLTTYHQDNEEYEHGIKLTWKELKQKHQKEELFKDIDMMDILDGFQEFHRIVWEQPLEDFEKKIKQQQHQDRIARDGFKQLLNELEKHEKLNAHTQWKQIYSLIHEDQRYHQLLGVPGSTPIDLFWDKLDELDYVLYQQRKKVQDYMKQHDFQMSIDTTLEQYLDFVQQSSSLLDQIDKVNIPLIYTELHKKEIRKQHELERKQMKKLQHKIKSLKYAIRKLDNPPVQLNDTWEIVQVRLKENNAFMDLKDNEMAQKEAFTQVIKRLEAKQHGKENIDEDDDEEEDEEEGIIKED